MKLKIFFGESRAFITCLEDVLVRCLEDIRRCHACSMYTGGNSAKLFCDKLLTQQQQQQPLFLFLLTILGLPTSFPVLLWNGFASFLYRKWFPFLFLSYPFTSHPVSLPILSFHIFPDPFFFAYPIISYPVLSNAMLCFCNPFCFSACFRIPFLCLSCPILSLPVSLPVR